MVQADTLELINGHMQQQGQRRWHGANVWFDYEAKLDQRATEKAGTPQYVNVEVVNIQYPGGDHHVKKVDDNIRHEYSAEYAAWRANQEAPVDGFPLKEWVLLTKAQFKMLTDMGFKTVEQLAECPDNVKKQMLSSSHLVKDAQTFLESQDTKPIEVTNLRKKVEKLEMLNAKQQEQIELLMQRISATEGIDFK